MYWALVYSIKQFADLFSKKLGMSAAVLKQTLWGDFYFEAKTKKVRKGAQVSKKYQQRDTSTYRINQGDVVHIYLAPTLQKMLGIRRASASVFGTLVYLHVG